MQQFEITFPRPHMTVHHRQRVFIEGVPAGCVPQVYVLANDDLWYRQPPAEILDWETGCYTLRCYIGSEEHRSGWKYALVAILSGEALPHTLETLPELPGHCITSSVPVVRA